MIAIIGKNGMLGRELTQYCKRNNIAFNAFGHDEIDITNKLEVAKLDNYSLDLIVNCSAYTNVDLAESDIELADQVNNVGVFNLAQYAKTRNIKLVHYSTDYVFSGNSPTPYVEEDECAPQTVYGQTKRRGEQAIIESGCDYLIIRTSWLFGKYGNNFVNTMLKLSTKDELKVVCDQFGSPTYTCDLVSATLILVKEKKSGIYHIANAGSCSWYEFACTIMCSVDSTTSIISCSSSEYPSVAQRPQYSVLSTKKLSISYTMPSWQDALNKYINEVR